LTIDRHYASHRTTNFIYITFILIMASVALATPQQDTSPPASGLGYLTTNYLLAQQVAGSRVCTV
jgi:hypothetical protein